jgi:hypothetical protein
MITGCGGSATGINATIRNDPGNTIGHSGTAGTPSPPDNPARKQAPVASTESVAGALECGRPFTLPAQGALTFTGRFPAAVVASAGVVTGTVEVTSREPVRGVVTPGADVFLVQNGRIATVPLPQDALGVPWDLAAGVSRQLPGTATLSSCGPGGASLRPGRYELYARVVIARDGEATHESFGGPWALDVQ